MPLHQQMPATTPKGREEAKIEEEYYWTNFNGYMDRLSHLKGGEIAQHSNSYYIALTRFAWSWWSEYLQKGEVEPKRQKL